MATSPSWELTMEKDKMKHLEAFFFSFFPLKLIFLPELGKAEICFS